MLRVSYRRWAMLLLWMLGAILTVAHADEFDREVSFDIASESLAAALLDFAEQAKIQVVTSGAQLQQLQTNGLKGRYSARAALKVLLSGTGLTFREVGSGTVSIERPEQGRESERCLAARSGPADFDLQ